MQHYNQILLIQYIYALYYEDVEIYPPVWVPYETLRVDILAYPNKYHGIRIISYN